MNTQTQRKAGFALAGMLIAIGAVVVGHTVRAHAGATRPAATEFGFGPRTSAGHLYIATLQASQPLRTRTMQAFHVALIGADGQPVDGAHITVDGGMPQHGHGLPTRPRVTRHLGNGGYEIDGVRFSMGGWWELKLSITTAAGTDVITFNLNL